MEERKRRMLEQEGKCFTGGEGRGGKLIREEKEELKGSKMRDVEIEKIPWYAKEGKYVKERKGNILETEGKGPGKTNNIRSRVSSFGGKEKRKASTSRKKGKKGGRTAHFTVSLSHS